MKKAKLLAALACALLIGGLANSASAAPLKWTLTNVTFGDGGTAAGSFFYDAATNAYSLVSIVTTAGSSFAGQSYSTALLGNPTGTFAPIVIGAAASNDLTVNDVYLAFFFAAPLTGGGGTVAIQNGVPLFSSELRCNYDAPAGRVCSAGGGPAPTVLRNVVTGSVVATVVPVPSAVWLMGGALSLLAGMRRRAAT